MVASVGNSRRHFYLVVPLVQGRCCPLFHDWPQLDLGSSTLQTPLDRIGYTLERPLLAAQHPWKAPSARLMTEGGSLTICSC